MPEPGGEITAAFHADVAGDLRDGKDGILQHPPGLFHHHQFPVTAGRHAGLRFESGEKPGPRHAAPAGKVTTADGRTFHTNVCDFASAGNMEIPTLKKYFSIYF